MSYTLEPLVAGQLGDTTDLDPSTHPPCVRRVEYVLDEPPPADLIESFPVVLVSEDLAERLVAADLAGFILDDAVVVPSREYLELYADTPHKRYRWLRLIDASEPDAWLSPDGRLRVSDRMMRILEDADLTGCDITPV